MDKQKAQCLANMIKAVQDLLDTDLTPVQRHLTEHMRDLLTGMEDDMMQPVEYDGTTTEVLPKLEDGVDEETHEG